MYSGELSPPTNTGESPGLAEHALEAELRVACIMRPMHGGGVLWSELTEAI